MTAPIQPDEGLPNINVVRDFSYTITTSSIVYVRNYNFNPVTSTPVEVLLENKSQQVPITVDISASQEWVKIIDPVNNKSVVTPEGNVVLPTSSTKRILMNIDLPVEIEAVSDSNLQVSMSFYVRSGSFPINTGTEGSQGTVPTSRIDFSEQTMYLAPGEVKQNTARVYENGILVSFVPLTFFIENESIASVGQLYSTDSDTINIVNIEAIREGTTTLRVLWQKSETETITASATIIVTSATNSSNSGGDGSSGPQTGDGGITGFQVE